MFEGFTTENPVYSVYMDEKYIAGICIPWYTVNLSIYNVKFILAEFYLLLL